MNPPRFGPAAFLAALEDDVPARARAILAWVLDGGHFAADDVAWIDAQLPGDDWPAVKLRAIAARDGEPVPSLPAKMLPPT